MEKFIWEHKESGKKYEIISGDLPATIKICDIRKIIQNDKENLSENLPLVIYKIIEFVDFVCGDNATTEMLGKHYDAKQIFDLFNSLATAVCESVTKSMEKYSDVAEPISEQSSK